MLVSYPTVILRWTPLRWSCTMGMDTLPLLEKAVARKVAYIPGTHFYPDGGHANTLRLNFSACEPARITQGMQILGDLLKETLK